MHEAYMIRNDGKEFAVPIHPYMGGIDDYRNLESGEWLYDHTLLASVKDLYIKFVAWYIKYDQEITGENVIDDFLKTLTAFSYSVSIEFVEEHRDEILKAYAVVDSNISSVLKKLVEALDQEFLRVRYGGKYESNYGIKDIYFRVSSSGFNWYNIIWMFVEKNKNMISTVTIERDEASTGTSKVYTGKDGPYDHMATSVFLSESGNPVIEWKNRPASVRKHLALGGAIHELDKLPMNSVNAYRTYINIKESENNKPRFYNPLDYVMTDILNGGSVRDVIAEGSKYV